MLNLVRVRVEQFEDMTGEFPDVAHVVLSGIQQELRNTNAAFGGFSDIFPYRICSRNMNAST